MCKNKRSIIDCDDISHVRQLWEHEDILINQRMTWLGITQTILFTAYGVLIKFSGQEAPAAQEELKNLSTIIPVIGVATSFIIFLGILAAAIAMHHIKSKCNYECLGITNLTTYMGLLCGGLLPLVFVTSWLYVLFS